MNKEYILRNVRLSFSKNLIEASSTNGGKPRYTGNFILDMTTPEGKAQKAELDKVIAEIMAEEFKGRTLEAKELFLRDGNKSIDAKTDEPYEGYAGNYYISGARSEKKGPPLVVDRKRQPITQLSDQFPYAGDYVNAVVNIFSLNGKNDKGGDPTHGKKICCEIGTVQFVRSGESLGGGGKPTTKGLEDLGDEEPEDFEP